MFFPGIVEKCIIYGFNPGFFKMESDKIQEFTWIYPF